MLGGRTTAELDSAAFAQRKATRGQPGFADQWFVVSHDEYTALRMRRVTDGAGHLLWPAIEDQGDGFLRFMGMRLAIACEAFRIREKR